MNRKRNVNYIKPEDPSFLKALKKQAGYDDSNHKFDELQNDKDDFKDDDGESEQPQVVVLKEGDLTAEEAEAERKRIEKQESETKADLSQKIIFIAKSKNSKTESSSNNKRKNIETAEGKIKTDKKSRLLLSFNDKDDEEEVD